VKYEAKPIMKKIDLTDDEKKIYDIIKSNPPDMHIDMLVVLTGMGIGELSSVLFMLEMKNAVRVGDNNKYSVSV